jgi:hypothetical protein
MQLKNNKTSQMSATAPAERVHSTATACGDRLDASQARLLSCAVRERAAGLLPRHVVTLGAYKVKRYSSLIPFNYVFCCTCSLRTSAALRVCARCGGRFNSLCRLLTRPSRAPSVSLSTRSSYVLLVHQAPPSHRFRAARARCRRAACAERVCKARRCWRLGPRHAQVTAKREWL